MALPNPGDPNWGDDVNNEISRLDGDVQDAVSNASTAASTATQAYLLADDAKLEAYYSRLAADTAAASASAPTDQAVEGVLTDETSQSRAVLNNAFVGQGVPLLRPVAPAAPNVSRMFGAHYAGHPWTVMGGAVSSNLNDTTDYWLGTQSVQVVTNTTAGDTGVRLDGITADFTGKGLRLYMKYDDFAKAGRVSVFVYSGTGSEFNSALGVIDLTGNEAPTKFRPGEWQAIDIPWSRLYSGSGNVNRAAVNSIRLYVRGKTGQSATYNFAGVAAVPEDELNAWPSGVLTFTLDDNHMSQLTEAVPYLDRYGYRATFFPIMGREAGYMQDADYRRLHAQGHEIGAHASGSTSHSGGWDVLTEGNLVTELETLRKWQADNGFLSTSAAYPLGNWDTATAQVVSRYYDSVRLAEGGFHELARPVTPHAVRCLDGSVTPLATIQAEMDRAKASRGWVNIMVHSIVPTVTATNEVSVADFRAIVDYANTLGMAVRTQGEVIARARG